MSTITLPAEFHDAVLDVGANVLRSGLLFRCGRYDDKSFSLDKSELAAAVRNFKPVPIDLEHVPTILSEKQALGTLQEVATTPDGLNLIGTACLPRWLHDLMGSEPLKVSTTWDRATKRIRGLALVREPRITDAALFSAARGNLPAQVEFDLMLARLDEGHRCEQARFGVKTPCWHCGDEQARGRFGRCGTCGGQEPNPPLPPAMRERWGQDADRFIRQELAARRLPPTEAAVFRAKWLQAAAEDLNQPLAGGDTRLSRLQMSQREREPVKMSPQEFETLLRSTNLGASIVEQERRSGRSGAAAFSGSDRVRELLAMTSLGSQILAERDRR